jgi:hypothetical protein
MRGRNCTLESEADHQLSGNPAAASRWTKALRTPQNRKFVSLTRLTRRVMITTGEAIRMMNYVDDISTTLRRIAANIPFMTDEERKRLADYMRKAEPSYPKMIETLEKGS